MDPPDAAPNDMSHNQGHLHAQWLSLFQMAQTLASQQQTAANAAVAAAAAAGQLLPSGVTPYTAALLQHAHQWGHMSVGSHLQHQQTLHQAAAAAAATAPYSLHPQHGPQTTVNDINHYMTALSQHNSASLTLPLLLGPAPPPATNAAAGPPISPRESKNPLAPSRMAVDHLSMLAGSNSSLNTAPLSDNSASNPRTANTVNYDVNDNVDGSDDDTHSVVKEELSPSSSSLWSASQAQQFEQDPQRQRQQPQPRQQASRGMGMIPPLAIPIAHANPNTNAGRHSIHGSSSSNSTRRGSSVMTQPPASSSVDHGQTEPVPPSSTSRQLGGRPTTRRKTKEASDDNDDLERDDSDTNDIDDQHATDPPGDASTPKRHQHREGDDGDRDGDDARYICPIPDCGSSFHTMFAMKRHNKKHTGEKPFACNYCQRKFGEKSTLKRHERMHTGEKLICCIYLAYLLHW